MKRKICVISGSRAEYGLLRLIMKKIKINDALELQIILTGTHLESKYGLTIGEFTDENFIIDRVIYSVNKGDSRLDILTSIATCVTEIGKALDELKPDLVLIVGDRFEMLSAAISAYVLLIPIGHIHGGELTFGALDEGFRHSITKLSQIHFVSTKEYARRVIQLGETPENVIISGGLGVDAIANIDLYSKEEIESKLDFRFGEKNLLVTFHPETNFQRSSKEQVEELLSTLEEFEDINYILTMPNADTGGNDIYEAMKEFVSKNKNSILVRSLGSKLYLSCLQYVDGVVGNSSSGLLEAPSFKIGTINIGSRQKGRTQADSVLNCNLNRKEIRNAIRILFSTEFQKEVTSVINPYGNGGASDIIVEILSTLNLQKIREKTFYDLDFKVPLFNE